MPSMISRNSIVVLVLVSHLLPVSAHEFDIEQCMKTPKPAVTFDPSTVAAPREDCANRAMIHSQWHADGSPTVILKATHCEYDGQQGTSPEECLPDVMDFAYVELRVAKGISTNIYVKFFDELRNRGVSTVQIESLENGI